MSETLLEMAAFLAQTVVISLSGVMAPGAMTAASLAAGARSRHAGALLAVGHGIVEFPLMFAILAGMGAIFATDVVKIGVGLAGGAILLVMAVQMFRSAGRTAAAAPPPKRGAVLTGVMLTAGNPYFLIWWATIGLALSLQAKALGVAVFALFAVCHWLCDLIWLEALTLAAHKGASLAGGKFQRAALLICGAALAVFGGRFLVQAAASLIH